MSENTVTIVGNLTADPELKFTPEGKAVANFTIADTPRYFDKVANEWKDGTTLYMPCSVWRETAENVAESLRKGSRVIASGKIKQRNWETGEGEKRKVVEMEVTEIGPSLRFATANVTKRPPAAPNGNGNGNGVRREPVTVGGGDLWGGGSQGVQGDEPPF